MKKSIENWKRLFELCQQFYAIKPWEKLWSEDYVCIETAPEEYVYCTIMGRNGQCIGLSVYEGESGYADLCSISQNYRDLSIVRYVMYEQTCITLYFGNNNEVPKEQKNIMKELGLKYRGKGQWPYFLSFEPQYHPSTLSDLEVKRMIQIMEKLIIVCNEYINKEIDIHFEDDEMIFAHLENKQWIVEPMSIPEEIDKFTPVILEDKSVYSEIKKQKKNNQSLYIDLVYIDSYFEDKEFKKPINGLLFIVVDKKSKMVIHINLLKPTDDQIGLTINFFINYLFEQGIPESVFIRNPTVFSALAILCDQCGIQNEIDDFKVVNQIVDEMSHML